MRYIIVGIIMILLVILVFVIIDQIVYWISRIFVSKHTAQIIHWSFSVTLLFTIIVSCVWGHYVTRLTLNVNHIEVHTPNLPAAFDGFRIAHLSDMHLDSFDTPEGHAFLTQLSERLQTEHPDVILFTGDIVSRQSEQAEPFRHELTLMATIPDQSGSDSSYIPVYAVLGNHDYADYTPMTPRQKFEDVQHLCSIFHDCGWQLLRNQSVTLTTDSASSLALIGVDNIGEPPFSTYGDLSKAMKGIDASAFKILLSHNPTHWRSEVLPTTDIDLTLSGHTHAMQFQVGSWSPSEWKYPEWGGLYAESGQGHQPRFLYVNTGLGGVGPRVRIGVQPELTIITLRKP